MSENPRRFTRCRKRFSGQEFLNPAFFDHAGGIVVRIVPVSAALTDKRSLGRPIVRGSECTLSTFLRTVLGRNRDDEFASAQCFVAREHDPLAPCRGENSPVQARFRGPPVGQKMALGVFFCFGPFGHLLDRQILKDVQVVGCVDHKRVTGLMRILVSDVLFVLGVVSHFSVGFLLILRTFFLREARRCQRRCCRRASWIRVCCTGRRSNT